MEMLIVVSEFTDEYTFFGESVKPVVYESVAKFEEHFLDAVVTTSNEGEGSFEIAGCKFNTSDYLHGGGVNLPYVSTLRDWLDSHEHIKSLKESLQKGYYVV